MIADVERSPSSKAKCNRCGKVIKLGERRLLATGYYHNHSTKSYSCVECGLKELEEEFSRLNNITRKLNGELELSNCLY